jgi:hypothetical protein
MRTVKKPRVIASLIMLLLPIMVFCLIPSQNNVLAQGSTTTLTTSITPSATSVQALSVTPTPKTRSMIVTEEYKGFLWWLVNQKDNKVLCSVPVEHEGHPTESEIVFSCGTDLHQQLTTGVYIHFVSPFVGKRERHVTYPLPSAWLTLSGCEPEGQTNRCEASPGLVITGEEQMENEKVVTVEGLINDNAFKCYTNPCTVTIPVTGPQGVRVEFWVNSSLGDSSKKFTALVRSVQDRTDGELLEGENQPYYVDVASRQWRGDASYSCSHAWESLPEESGLLDWLSSPQKPELMQTNTAFYHLAGALIRSGQVDVTGCPDGGMQTRNIPNVCGMQRADSLVVEWQNQFDQIIIEVARQNNIPAMLLKNIFSVESQFWPGVYSKYNEVGLGQMTDNGADTLFSWNPVFFEEFCRVHFNAGECAKGYFNLPDLEKTLLRGALLSKLDSSCADCLTKIDQDQAEFSINIFAKSLGANCEQAAQIFNNRTGKVPGLSSSYEDLWKFTLVNYNAGSGCLQNSIIKAQLSNQPLTWENVSGHLEPACQESIKYIEKVTKVQRINSGGD